MSNDVINFYTNEYSEDNRLSVECDNRHRVEREVKRIIYNRLLKPNSKVLEIGAGTGVHSIYLASKGHEVTATDIVPKHFDIMCEKAKRLGLNIEVRVEDALNLNISNKSYDAVLLAGPIYHLHTTNDKEKAIKEAVRVCRNKGIVIVDYLPLVHGFIQQCLRYTEFLEGCTQDDIAKLNCKDETFSYDTVKDMESMLSNCGLRYTNSYGTDGITRFIKEDINTFSDEKLANWINVVDRLSMDENIIGLSEHAIAVGYK